MFITSPFVIKVALAIITLSATLFICLSFIAIVANIIDRIKAKSIRELKQAHSDFILEILNDKQVKTAAEIQLEFAKKGQKLNRNSYHSLIPTLTAIIESNSAFQETENYHTLLSALEIDSHLERKLDFASIENKLKTFQQLSKLKIVISDSKILPYTFSKNRNIRKGARNAYIGISNNNPFKFFDQEDNQINNWDQITLLEQLELHHKNNLPNLSNWLKYSKNESQIVFIIKAAGYFKQYNTVNTLIELLDVNSHEIRQETIKALGLMQIQKVNDKLIEMFPTQPSKCQDAIIEAIFNINSQNAISFFVEAFNYTSNYESKKLIAEAIYLSDNEDRSTYSELLTNSIGFNKTILEHIKNPLNNHRLKALGDSNILVLDNRDEGNTSPIQTAN